MTIPTRYNGIQFRSRTEARWAVLFDSLSVRWQYELEGYQLSKCWYLPDFWLPEWRSFAEVKGAAEDWTQDVVGKCRELASQTQRPFLLLDEIRVSSPLVPVVLPDEPCAIAEHGCDLVQSRNTGRIWHESHGSHDDGLIDSDWAHAASRAITRRFRYMPRGRLGAVI